MQKRTLAELMSYLADRGEFGEDGEALDPDVRDLIQAGALEAVRAYERTRPNGAVIEVRSIALPNGGLVRTLTDTTARKASETQIAHMALHDALTGLSNRIMLLQRMEQSFARLRRHGEEFALMYLDLGSNRSTTRSVTRSAISCSGKSVQGCARARATPTSSRGSAAMNSPCCNPRRTIRRIARIWRSGCSD